MNQTGEVTLLPKGIDRNPARGCGKKKNDAFYAESTVGAGGILSSWAWLLGNGVDPFPVRVPARQPVVINPVATIMEQELVLASDYIDKENRPYLMMRKRIPEVGLGDHVGASYYSPMAFAKETMAYGASRRLTRTNAELMAILLRDLGPIPVVFTHSMMPVFQNSDAVDRVVDGLLEGDFVTDPTWEVDDWSCYSGDGKYKGHDHFMCNVLDYLDILNNMRASSASRAELASYFDEVTFIEQPFGVAWITQISYTLPEDGQIVDNSILSIPGIDILDLKPRNEEILP